MPPVFLVSVQIKNWILNVKYQWLVKLDTNWKLWLLEIGNTAVWQGIAALENKWEYSGATHILH
jgi:hypothetical protein